MLVVMFVLYFLIAFIVRTAIVAYISIYHCDDLDEDEHFGILMFSFSWLVTLPLSLIIFSIGFLFVGYRIASDAVCNKIVNKFKKDEE